MIIHFLTQAFFLQKRMDESDLIKVPETGFSLHQGWLLGHPKIDTYFTSGEFMEVSQQFPIRQYQPRAVQFVSPQMGATTTPLNRGALNGVSIYCVIIVIYLQYKDLF